MSTTAWKAISVAVLAVILIALAYGMGRWWGDVHMAVQPSVGPQQTVVRLPEGSVSRDSLEPFRRPNGLDKLVVARRAAAEAPNPVPDDEHSLERGRFVYETHCQVCHGTEGRGDGPVGELFVPPPMDLSLPYVQEQADGQIFYTISYGSLIMPAFYHAISVEDRWRVVNYLRSMGAQ